MEKTEREGKELLDRQRSLWKERKGKERQEEEERNY